MQRRVQFGPVAGISFAGHSLAQNIELEGPIVCFNVKPSESRLHITPSFVCECVAVRVMTPMPSRYFLFSLV